MAAETSIYLHEYITAVDRPSEHDTNIDTGSIAAISSFSYSVREVAKPDATFLLPLPNAAL
jgi:hypothetical protein